MVGGVGQGQAQFVVGQRGELLEFGLAGLEIIVVGGGQLVEQVVPFLPQGGQAGSLLAVALGFGFVELLMPCTTAYIKSNKIGDTKESWDWYRANTITRGELAELSPEERAANEKIVIGTLWEADKPEYSRQWAEFVGGLG